MGSPQPDGERAAQLSPDAILALQVRLDRAGCSPGEIDARLGANVRRAIVACQRRHGLPETGAPDQSTMEMLQATDPEPPIAHYVIAPEDVARPFTPEIAGDLVAQADLPRLDYRSTLELLAERFHADPDLLRRLNPHATFSAAGETIAVPNVTVVPLPAEPVEPATGAVTVMVSRGSGSLVVSAADGREVLHAPVSTGSEHDPLPIGEWQVTEVRLNPIFNYNPELFWDADPSHARAQIQPGPNNPVGLVWIGLTREHYGLHGTPEPGRVGHTQSHGCVRLTNWDALRVASLVRKGTRVVFQE